MSYDFNADDVFEMAEQMERNGGKFYRTAADNTEDSANKEFLLELATMEDQHEKTFKAMRTELSDREKASTVFDPQGESAIEAEKDSIVFYLGMKEAVPENLGQGRLDHIIKEEMGHIRLLSKKLVEHRG